MQTLIDSHVHFWQPDRLRYPWLDELPTLNRPYFPGHLPVSGEGWSMAGCVFVQCDCLPEQGAQEAEWVSALAQSDHRIAAIVAFAPLELGHAARPILETLRQLPLVKGVRRLIQSEPLGFSTQPGFVQGVKLLSDDGLSFDLCIKHPQLPDVIELVRQCPKVAFALDHIGKPDIKNGQLDPWREQIKTLAAFPNVMCKISGMVTEADWSNWRPEHLQPYIDHVLEVFGIDRVMYGGDWPVVELAAAYPLWVETLLVAVTPLSDAEKRKLFYDNARAFYRLESA